MNCYEANYLLFCRFLATGHSLAKRSFTGTSTLRQIIIVQVSFFLYLQQTRDFILEAILFRAKLEMRLNFCEPSDLYITLLFDKL